MAAAPEKALVLAMTRRMLYGEDPPYVGVGLVYKPHYISTESFCAAYMHLNVWHAAGSSADSADKLDSSRFILAMVLEMSGVVPVVALHPIFLDVGSKEAMVLSADLLNVLNLHPGDPAFRRAKELIQKHHQSVSMKVNLPLIELEVAKEDLERFLQGCLRELSSNPKAREVVEEISQILSSYGRRVWETILVLGVEQPGVFN